MRTNRGGSEVLGSGRTWPHDFLFLVFFSPDSPDSAVYSGIGDMMSLSGVSKLLIDSMPGVASALKREGIIMSSLSRKSSCLTTGEGVK